MTSHRQELGLTASRVRRLLEALPETGRPSIAEEWRALLEAVEDEPRERERLRLIAEWRECVEERLTSQLLNAPLEANRG